MVDVICTKRLLLRALQAGDAQPLFALFNDWEVVRWLSTPPWPCTLDDTRAFVARKMSLAPDLGPTAFVITLDGNVIGSIEARAESEPARPDQRVPQLGYWLGKPYWGQGYMTEASRGFITHVFAASAADTIYSGAFADNTASLHVQHKLGFVQDSQTMAYAKPRGGEFLHVNTTLTRSRFESLSASTSRSVA